MKKLTAILIVVGLCVATIFAQDLEGNKSFRVSLGGGGTVTGNFSTWKVDPDIPGNLYRYNSSHLSVGPFIFFDMKFMELNFGIPLGWLNGDDTTSADPNFPAQTLALNGGAYFKVPIALTQTVTLFPLLGIDYDLYVMAKKDDDRDAKFPISTSNLNAKPSEALNTLWFKGGVGLDTFLNDNLFIRTELLYGFRLKNEMEKYLYDQRPDSNRMLGNGGTFKLAVGYRF